MINGFFQKLLKCLVLFVMFISIFTFLNSTFAITLVDNIDVLESLARKELVKTLEKEFSEEFSELRELCKDQEGGECDALLDKEGLTNQIINQAKEIINQDGIREIKYQFKNIRAYLNYARILSFILFSIIVVLIILFMHNASFLFYASLSAFIYSLIQFLLFKSLPRIADLLLTNFLGATYTSEIPINLSSIARNWIGISARKAEMINMAMLAAFFGLAILFFIIKRKRKIK